MPALFKSLGALLERSGGGDSPSGERIPLETLVSCLRGWLDDLASSIDQAGKQPDAPSKVWEEPNCEATRMVLGILSILQAYYPDEWPKELGTLALDLFDKAYSVAKDYPKDDVRYLFKKNIGERRDSLRHLQEKWSL